MYTHDFHVYCFPRRLSSSFVRRSRFCLSFALSFSSFSLTGPLRVLWEGAGTEIPPPFSSSDAECVAFLLDDCMDSFSRTLWKYPLHLLHSGGKSEEERMEKKEILLFLQLLLLLLVCLPLPLLS